MIRIQVDPKLRPLWAVCVECFLSFTTHRLHPSCDYWRYAAIKRAELRNPSRPKARLS